MVGNGTPHLPRPEVCLVPWRAAVVSSHAQLSRRASLGCPELPGGDWRPPATQTEEAPGPQSVKRNPRCVTRGLGGQHHTFRGVALGRG